MSFENLPQVDRFSENEDEGNTLFVYHFSQRCGFLATKPTADKGCDFLMELKRGGEATNWRFPIQIKSVEKLTLIDNGRFISYPFKTSRLHYMMEAVPPVALIVLYDVENRQLYYDYAEAIYNRLLEKHEGGNIWKTGGNINIHIPSTNLVDEHSVARIHSTILQRHQNSSDRSPALYANPPMQEPPILAVDAPQLISSPVEVLKNDGLYYYYNNNIPLLEKLLDEVPVRYLREDAHLSFLAGITYWAMGMPVDASFFLGKALSKTDINAEDRQHAEWANLHLDQYLGKISLAEYNERIKLVLTRLAPDTEELRLQYELCIVRNNIDLLGPRDMKAVIDIANQFRSYGRRITATELSAAAYVRLMLQNTNNLGLLMLKTDWFFRWRFTVEKKDGTSWDAEMVAEFDSLISKLAGEVDQVFPRLKPLARNFVDRVMLAHCLEAQVSILIHRDLNALQYPISEFDFSDEGHHKRLLLNNHFATEALEIFLEHHLYRNAINVALMLLELHAFAEHSLMLLDSDVSAVRQKAEWLRQKLSMGPLKIQAEKLIPAYKAAHP